MALNKPQHGVIQIGGNAVSLAEAARLLREIASREDLMILTITKTWARYWMYILTLPAGNWPDYYSIEAMDNTIIIRFSKDKKHGYKKVVKRGGSRQITIPTRLVKRLGEIEPGPVLAEVIDSNTLVVYLG